MNHSLQERILTIPIHQLTFLTSLPKEAVHFENIIESIPETWLESKTILVLTLREEWEKLNEKEVVLRFVQDPNLMGVVLCATEPPDLHEEVYQFFKEMGLPLICVHDGRADTYFKEEKECQSFRRLSLELQGFMDKGFVHIAAEMAKALNTPLLYLDQHDKLLWQTGENKGLKAANRWLNTHYKKENQISNKSESDIGFEVFPIHLSKGVTHTLLVSLENESWQRKMVDKFTGLMAVSIQTEGMFHEQQELFKEHFVYDLLYHKFESHKVMVKQGKNWGWNLEKPHHLLLINVTISDGVMTNLNCMNEILLALEAQIAKMEERIIVFPFRDQIVVMLEDEQIWSINQRHKYVVEIARQLAQVQENLAYCKFFIGIGKWYQNTTHMNKSYQEAKMALQFGSVWFETKNVYHINDLGVLRLLIQIHQEVLSDYKDEYLLPLMESDRVSGTEYIKTLQAYIRNKGRINEVSDELFVHSNTLRNRIKKIEELTGIDMQDPEEFMNLIIGIKIMSFIES